MATPGWAQDTLCLRMNYPARGMRPFQAMTFQSSCLTQSVAVGCTALNLGAACRGQKFNLLLHYRSQTFTLDSMAYGFLKYNWTITVNDVPGQRKVKQLVVSFDFKTDPYAGITDPQEIILYTFPEFRQQIQLK